jgi:hypothetical protein
VVPKVDQLIQFTTPVAMAVQAVAVVFITVEAVPLLHQVKALVAVAVALITLLAVAVVVAQAPLELLITQAEMAVLV